MRKVCTSGLALQAIKQNSWWLGGVSLLVVGDFLQLPPVNQKLCLQNQERIQIGHSKDGCGKNFH